MAFVGLKGEVREGLVGLGPEGPCGSCWGVVVKAASEGGRRLFVLELHPGKCVYGPLEEGPGLDTRRVSAYHGGGLN